MSPEPRDPHSNATETHLLRVRRRERVDDVREVAARVSAPGLPPERLRELTRTTAAQDPFDRLETFGVALARALLDAAGAGPVHVDLAESEWARISTLVPAGRAPHPRAFRDAGEELVLARVTAAPERVEVESGVSGLRLLRTADVAGVAPRVIVADARWQWSAPPRDWAVEGSRAREALLGAFAAGGTGTLRETAQALARAVLDGVALAARVHVTLRAFDCVPAVPGTHSTVYEPGEGPAESTEAAPAR